MALPNYRVESVIGYRNPLRHGIRGKTRYAITAPGWDKIEARVTAESVLVAHFRVHFPHLEIKSLESKAAVELPVGSGTAGEIVEIEVVA